MNSAETVLLLNIDKPNSCFVFPTDIAVSRWTDHLLRLKGGSVAMNKFIAWDVFKQNSIKSKIKNKMSIPTVLRKIFISRLVNKNAENCVKGITPVFNSLIQIKWAGQATQFTSWLTGILPQLGIWYKKKSGHSINNILNPDTEKISAVFEGDDKDLFILARHYALFLERHNLFEPAWETPPFNDEGKEYFIFFPRSLSDFSEYKHLLEASSHIKIINAQNTNNSPFDSFFYTNSRKEITEAALYIRALHENKNINWDSIAVCIPDAQNYEPYLIREFKNRDIPFVKRISKPLSDYPAGCFFRCILDCVTQNLSFSSLVSLLINRNLPWNDTIQTDKLIRFGIENNCIYSWAEKIDGKEQFVNVWEDAFSEPVNGLSLRTKYYFENIKRHLQLMRYAPSFSELRRQYFIFRELFFNMEKCSEETNLILSRCITELINLAEIEKDFPELRGEEDGNKIKFDHFLFFTDYLREVFYLAQQKTSGVSILPYKTAAAAPFDCHVILGAGQENLSVIYTNLDFLPKKKRGELCFFDDDASLDFINLHILNSNKISAFFCSEQIFSGFAIPHSKIGFPFEPENSYITNPALSEKFSADHYSEEKFFSQVPISEFSTPLKLHENQLKGFLEWKNRRYMNMVLDEKWSTGIKVQELIRSLYERNGKYSVSASSLQSYFQCSLKWLFERVFSLENIQIETSLMHENITGLIYHAILNNFFTKLKNNNEILLEPVNTEFGITLPSVYCKLLESSINAVFNFFPVIKQDESKSEIKINVLTSRFMNAGRKDFQFHLESCLANFLTFFAGCRVTGTETIYKAEKGMYLLTGIIDCILKETSGKSENNYIIVDFKLKNLPKRKDCTGENNNILSNFQLPMYLTLAEENNKYSVSTALFYSIIDSKPEVIIGAIKNKDAESTFPKSENEIITHGNELYKRIFDEFSEKTRQFSQELSSGNFTVFETKSSNCIECYYRRICRTVYVIDRENIKNFQEYKWL
jgi:hypothetical protein